MIRTEVLLTILVSALRYKTLIVHKRYWDKPGGVESGPQKKRVTFRKNLEGDYPMKFRRNLCLLILFTASTARAETTLYVFARNVSAGGRWDEIRPQHNGACVQRGLGSG